VIGNILEGSLPKFAEFLMAIMAGSSVRKTPVFRTSEPFRRSRVEAQSFARVLRLRGFLNGSCVAAKETLAASVET
jgi:hypothetical protein